MDPLSGAASIIAVATLSRDIIETCRKYTKNFRDAPVTVSRFCDELEALSVLLERFLDLQNKTQNGSSSAQSGVLAKVLRRAHLLKDYERQLRKLKETIDKFVDVRNVGHRLRFMLREQQIQDGLDVVQRIRSILDSALRLDDSSYTQSIHSEVQNMNAIIKIQNQMLIDSSRRDAKLRETLAMLRYDISQERSTHLSGTASISQVRELEYLGRQSRKVSYRSRTKRIFDLSFGRISTCKENSAESSESHQTSQRQKRSRFALSFVPSAIFWQTVILLQVEWTARLDSFTAPMFSLQFLDIVRDDHPIIRASIRGDLDTLRGTLSGQRGIPLCSTKAGWTPLHFAAAYGQIDACRVLMEQGAPLGATGIRGITPLHIAAHFGHFEVFKTLLKAGSDPDDCHEHGLNAVLEILSCEMVSNSPGLPEFWKWLLHGQEQFLLDTEAKDNSNRGILYHLAYPPGWTKNSNAGLTTEQSETIEIVLHGGVRGDELDIHKISVLHEACRDGRLDLVQILLSGDCHINATDGRGYTPLHYAVESRNFDLVSTLIKDGSDVNACAEVHDDYHGYFWSGYATPLYLAVKLGWMEMVKFLIQHGAGCCQYNVWTAFYVAVCEENLEIVQYFIENGADQLDLSYAIGTAGDNSEMIEILHKAGAPLDFEDENGWTPLAWAARCGRTDRTKQLAELGADLDKISQDLTALGHAVHNGFSDAVNFLLAAGAHPRLTGSQMPTPWQLATSRGFDQIADNIALHDNASSNHKLIENLLPDAMKNMVDVKESSVAIKWNLTLAAKNGDVELVERLLEKGCRLEAGHGSPQCPLTIAIIFEQWAVAEKLIEAGAELNKCRGGQKGRTDMPFMQAVVCDNAAFIELMIRHGADINIRDFKGSTPLLQCLDLFWSFRACHKSEAVRTLLSAGANVNVTDNFGRTPLGKAAAIGNFEAVVALVEAGADLNQISSQNSSEPPCSADELTYRTPIAWAALGGHENVVKYLFDSGAEWRNLKKEPALSYAHRLLMESWFPKDAEAFADDMTNPVLTSVSFKDGIGDPRNQSPDENSNEATATPVEDHSNSTSSTRHTSNILYRLAVSTIRLLARWIRILHDRLQSFRIEAVAFTCVSLLLLARGGLRYFSVPNLANVKLAVLALVIGLILAPWVNQSVA